jgi:hypothetical protein
MHSLGFPTPPNSPVYGVIWALLYICTKPLISCLGEKVQAFGTFDVSLWDYQETSVGGIAPTLTLNGLSQTCHRQYSLRPSLLLSVNSHAKLCTLLLAQGL